MTTKFCSLSKFWLAVRIIDLNEINFKLVSFDEPECTTGHMTRGVSVWGGLYLGFSVQGDLCPEEGVSVQGVSVWGSLSRGCLSRGISVQGGLCPGRVSVQGVSVQGVSVGEETPPDRDPPPYGKCAGDMHPTGIHSCSQEIVSPLTSLPIIRSRIFWGVTLVRFYWRLCSMVYQNIRID